MRIQRSPIARRLSAARTLFLSLATASCAGAGESTVDNHSEGTGPAYAMLAVTFGPDDSATSYVVLSDTLDLDRRVSLDGAREFAGRRNIASASGRLFVGSYDEPVIDRYSFSDDLTWIDEGTLNFANQGAQDARPESLVSERVAYAPLGEHDPLRTLWNPQQLKISATREQTSVPQEKDGLAARWGGYPFEERQGPPMRTVMYDDGDFFEIAPSTTVVVYDPKTHEETRIFEVPCPGLYQGDQDEAGNTYLTSVASPTLALYGRVQGSCVRRIGSDGTLDDEWNPDLSSWIGGRQLSSFEYVGHGKAIGNVLHHEELEAMGADFSGPFDPDVYDESQNGNHYRPWLFDLEAESAKPIEGVEQGLAADAVELDGRMFLNVTYDEWGRTVFYEVNADGSATRRFEVPAYVESWVRVR